MTDSVDSINSLENDTAGGAETTPGELGEEATDPGVELHRMSRRLGEKVKTARKPRILKLICMMLALGSGAARAQSPGGIPVTSDSGTGLHRSAGLAPATTPAPQGFEQSLVGSDRLGISLPLVSNAPLAREPLAPFTPASLRHRGPGVALMIVGAAAIVTGLLVDESLITILGAGTGLVGLYLYLR